jgi:hypothetical protein
MSPATQLKPPPLEAVSDHPPAPTAAAVLEQRAAKERELASLERTIGATAHAAIVTGKTSALVDLHGRIQAARFELEASDAAHAFAIKADQAAVADWWAQVHAMPAEEAIEGLSTSECCRRCSEAGCVLSGGLECIHPSKTGSNLNPRHQGNPAIRRLHTAAAKKLGVYR